MTFTSEMFWRVAEPIVKSHAFKRLRGATFLGVLSPKFKQVRDYPFYLNNNNFDQSRAHHSLAVSLLAARTADKAGLSSETVSYAIAWGLLHDIATWPLSHTGEAAFTMTTGTSGHKLREQILSGSHKLASRFSARKALIDANISVDILLALYNKNLPAGLSSELRILHKILHSPLNPDTLEGMHRTGRTLGVWLPDPELFINAFTRDLVDDIRLNHTSSYSAFSFWRGKSKIYKRYINKTNTMVYETRWSEAIANKFSSLTIDETLDLEENEITREAHRCFCKANFHEILRYKPPLRYSLSHKQKKQRSFKYSVAVDSLSETFVKTDFSLLGKLDDRYR